MHKRFPISDLQLAAISPSPGTPGEGWGGGCTATAWGTPTLTLPRRTGGGNKRGGFTFLEVLFAIIVLGVGFIMVAAMFPAALKQTQAAVEDATGSALWVNASRKFSELARQRIPPPSPNAAVQYYLDVNMQPADGSGIKSQADSLVHWFFDPRLPKANRDALWEFARANIIFEEDPRFAVVPLFRREKDLTATPIQAAAEAQLYLIAVRCRSHAQYDASDLENGRLDPNMFTVTVHLPDTTNPDAPYIVFSTGNASQFGALAPGAYVVISDANQPPNPAIKAKNGQVYRLGQPVASGVVDTYYIAPDAAGASDVYNANTFPAGGYGAVGLVVGRGINPATGDYEGGVQELAIVPVPLKLR
jgi:type II secretory pathway pseudopilin PulG